MIIESLKNDKSKITFDGVPELRFHGAMLTLTTGATIELPDHLYNSSEVQGAIKLGFIKVVGEPPVLAQEEAAPTEKKIKLMSKAKTRMAFDCIKGSVSPGEMIHVPESKYYHPEIQNALNWGLLIDPDAKVIVKDRLISNPIMLEEVSITDEETPKAKPKAPAKTTVQGTRSRPAVKAPGTIKAKPIGRSEDSGIEGDDGDADNTLLRSSVLHEPKAENFLEEPTPPAKKALPKAPLIEVKADDSEDDSVGFEDIFK